MKQMLVEKTTNDVAERCSRRPYQRDRTMRETLQQKTAFAWVLLITCCLLFIPLVAMQFSNEVRWALADFVIMGALLLVVGSSLILLARKLSKKQFQLAAIVVLLGFIYVWVELAVGVFFSLGS